ncbi:hypothetical protein [Aliivibrio fischeri]|uniref:hypothetical protein n=1 Tax=Aliivibrio fischeri TaxID=668 RepID=UPI0012DA283A|nr:hypothetical protein [Aliivibrio fischeri]MUJ39727.1 hypothetical protein [Aliivibrio fischeri]
MSWFIRFSLGLKARKSDVEELKKELPELFKSPFDIIKYDRVLHEYPFIWHRFYDPESIIEALHEWVRNELDNEVYIPQQGQECRAPNCPMKTSSQSIQSDGSGLLNLQVAAGGPKAKPPKDSFLNLVKQTHPNSDMPREIILTDPYIYSDVSEDGKDGGYNNLLDYLSALGLSKDDSFILRMTPSPKRGTKKSRMLLHRFLKKNYKNITLKDYSPKLKFHDRFYVVLHRSGAIRGLFGPSLNGLNSDAIVLMGDIEGIQPNQKLQQWFC